MNMRVIGAGLGRTGTHSLKVALEHLLGAPCYHMLEVFQNADHVPIWRAAIKGDPTGLSSVLDGYAASVDWPGGACWRELRDLAPEAVVLLSVRASAEDWWNSADATILESLRRTPDPEAPEAVRSGMVREMMDYRFTPRWDDAKASMAAYEAHNAAVRAEVPKELIVEWTPGQGWAPLCAALGLPIPEIPFPHMNTSADYRAKYKFDL